MESGSSYKTNEVFHGSFWEMHSTDLFRMPHWASVMSRSVKVLRGTSMVWMDTSPYCAPCMASALVFTIWRVSAGSKCCWNLLPHGARMTRRREGPASLDVALPGLESWGHRWPLSGLLSSPELLIWISAGKSDSSCLWGRTAPSHRLRLDMPLSRLGLTPDRFLSMEGRTLYLFNDCAGAPGPCCHTVGWDWGRRDLSARLCAGEFRGTGGLWFSSMSCELFTAGLLRPLDDFGLVKCIIIGSFPVPYIKKKQRFHLPWRAFFMLFNVTLSQ